MTMTQGENQTLRVEAPADFDATDHTEDIDQLGPEEFAHEDLKLRQAREAKQAKYDKSSHDTGPLKDSRFEKLNTVLERVGMYSTFLEEQMKSTVEEIENVSDQSLNKEMANNCNSDERQRKRAKVVNGHQIMPITQNVVDRTETRKLVPLLTGGDLTEYQRKGVKWLISHYQNGCNGILADQMGLGKTVQCIGFLSHLRENEVHGPFLIIAPLSTLSNWEDECRKWLPSAECLLYHGDKNERARMRATELKVPKGNGGVQKDFPIIITSYEIIIADIKFFQKFEFKYLVVDEGHRLKNYDCKLIRELRTLRSLNKLLLTGTPLQNNLAELWSLLNFIMPDIFDQLKSFESWFDFSSVLGDGKENQKLVEEERRQQVVSKLHRILQPFVLRRIKADVEMGLPSKREILMYAQMSSRQIKMNDILTRWQDRSSNDQEGLMKELHDELGYFQGKINTNNLLMQLRLIACHPDLVTGKHDGTTVFPSPEENCEQSGKMKLLDRMLKRLRKGNHKVLIFSQFKTMLDLLESHLSQLDYEPKRIDGSVSYMDRRQQIQEFNSDPDVFVFLLSTRAGGLGINLTAADTAIIYDSDWNPHQDLQAMDRCHRIGQTKPVHVYRLATAHSVENLLLKRASGKMKLDRVVMKRGAFLEGLQNQKTDASLSVDDLKFLLQQDISQDDVSQSADISDENLDRIMDRSDMYNKQGQPTADDMRIEKIGEGWEVMEAKDSSSLLSGVQGEVNK